MNASVICFITQVYFQDENRYSVSRGAHKNLRRAERARIMVSRMPGIYDKTETIKFEPTGSNNTHAHIQWLLFSSSGRFAYKND